MLRLGLRGKQFAPSSLRPKVGAALRAAHPGAGRPDGALWAPMRGSEIRAHLWDRRSFVLVGQGGVLRPRFQAEHVLEASVVGPKVGAALRAAHPGARRPGGALWAPMRGSEIRAHLGIGDRFGLRGDCMKRFFSALLERQWVSWVAAALVVVGGVVAWVRLPIDAFPDVTNVQVMVLTTASGLGAEDVEQRVTTPIELQMGGLPQVTQVRSLSRAGLSQVVVVFEDDVDPYFARQLVFERLQGAREGLPPGVEPELAPLSTGLGEIFQYTLEGDLSPMEKRTIQDWLVAPQLRSVPGVTEVNSLGGFVRQVQVLVHPDRLLAFGLSMRDVAEALERGNSSAGGGYILKGWEQMVIRGDGLFHSLQDVERVVLKVADGTPVLVRDVADVAFGGETRQGAVTRDGRGETVAGMVIMLRGGNSRTVVEAVKAQVGRIQHMLPAGLRLDVFYDRTDLIRACIRTVMEALLWGALLVVVVLFLFVAELRTSLIVVLSLPLTFLATFVVMGWAGLSSNLMSLGGLAFSVGMVVDASIVVVENVRRHLASRVTAPRRLVVVEALAEVARPVAFSVLVIALVLVPLLTLQGIEGKMFRPLALTLMFALLTSILVALFIVPTLCDRILAQREEREFGFVRRFHEAYLHVLGRAMASPRLTLGVALAFLAVSVIVVPTLGTEFIPTLDEGAIAINVVRLPNASLDGSVDVARLIEERVRRFEEVTTVVSKTGRAEISEDPMGPEQTDVFIMLKPRGEWRSGRTKAELIEALSKELAAIPGLRMAFSQPIALRVNELISGVKSDLAVKIFGPDLGVLKRLADQAAELVKPVAGRDRPQGRAGGGPRGHRRDAGSRRHGPVGAQRFRRERAARAGSRREARDHLRGRAAAGRGRGEACRRSAAGHG